MKKSIAYIFFAFLSGFAFSQTTITLENQCNCDVLSGTDISSPGSTTPEGATVGDVYVNTDTGVIYFWDGDSWEYTATDVPELQNFTFDSTTNVLSLEIEGGNIVTVDLSIANTDDQTASEVTITDSGDNFTATNVEGALAELATTSTISGNGDAWGVTGEDITSEINRSGNVIIGGTSQIGTTPEPKLAIQNFDNILTNSNITPINILQLHRVGRIGSKWDANAQFRLGSYSSDINSTTSLEIALTDLNHSSVYNTVMTMQANGDIGIGTVSPTTKLHVAGDARIETFTAGANTDDIVVADANGVLKTIAQSSISTANEPWFGTDNNAAATDNTEDIYAMGNVGIGTSSPTYKLEVSDLSLIQGLRVGRGNRTANTLVGTNALIANTTGIDNTSIGYLSLEANTSGSSNTAIGSRTLIQNVLGNLNTAVGNRALVSNATGNNNTALGSQAGDNITSGNNNIIIGSNIDAPSAIADNQLNIGNWIYGNGGNIGIGVSSPSEKLDVVGKTKTTNLQMTNGATAGHILQSDATGNATWVAPSTSEDGDAWGVTGEDITSEINRSGNVIIGGTSQIGTTPEPKLAVQNFDNAITNSNITPINILQLHRVGSIGSKWDANAQFRLGSYSSHVNSTTSLEIALTDINNSSVYNTVMTMQANGDIGIGTVSPTTKLHVAGDARIETFTAGANTDDIVVADANGVLKTIAQSSISTANEPWFGTDNNAAATDNTEDIYAMGNVGIGTSSPTYKLEVSDLSLIQGLRVGRGNRTANTLVGTNALIANTTGIDNTSIGYLSLEANTSGSSNTAIGSRTLIQNVLGNLNTAVGNRALVSNATGNNNTALGNGAGENITSGNHNIIIGSNIDAFSATADNQLNIGNWIYGDDGNIGIGINDPTYKLEVSDIALIQGLRIGRGNRTTNSIIGTNALIANTTGIDNTALGYLSLEGNTSGAYNTALGARTLLLNITGSSNSAVGNRALLNSTGNHNTALGSRAGVNITSGNNNIIIGSNIDAPSATADDQLNIGNWIYGDGGNIGIGTATPTYKLEVSGANSDALINGIRVGRGVGDIATNTVVGNGSLSNNTIGYGNTAIGKSTLSNNTTGYLNTVSGYQGLFSNTTGIGNVAIGDYALFDNTTGNLNTAIGSRALYSNIAGGNNTAVGLNTLRYNTNGNFNTAYGSDALEFNTVGFHNTATGNHALYKNTTGLNNTAIGSFALTDNIDGNYNTAVGLLSLANNTTGDNNTTIGMAAGDNITTGNNNIIIGSSTNAPSATNNNQLNIGNWIYGRNGDIGIGTATPTHKLHVIGTAGLSTGTSWTNTSDIRLKDIQGDYENGLKEILALHTVRFNYKENNPLNLPSNTNQIGFIAQEVQEIMPEAVITRKDGYLELNVDPIHWAMVNAFKEQQQQIEGLKKENLQIKDLKKENTELKKQLNSILERIEQLEK